jgi:DHA1 family bicyclomycin/chloramphenicol resistance-like MFS transporter
VALWAFGNAFIMPGTTAGALAPFPHIAGAASALTGFMQIGGGLFGTAAAALLFADPFEAVTIIMAVMAAVAVVVYFTLIHTSDPASRLMATVKPEDIEVAVDPAGIVGAGAAEIETITAARQGRRA